MNQKSPVFRFLAVMSGLAMLASILSVLMMIQFGLFIPGLLLATGFGLACFMFYRLDQRKS